MLIAAGADVKKPQDILIATFMGYESIVKELIDAGANVNARDWDSNTPLMQASDSAHHGIMRLLIAAGAYVNASTSYGRTPLMFAASRYAETVRILLEAGADVNAVSRSRTTALSYASHECKKEIEAFVTKKMKGIL
jgi:ankyrin repeat protein